MKHKIVGTLLCTLLIANVSAVLGVPEGTGNTIQKTESYVFVKLFNQEDMKYIIVGNTGESKIPYGTLVGPNVAPDPSFEEGDTMPAGWTYSPNTTGIYHWDSNFSYSGEKSIGVLNLTNNSNSSYLMWITEDFIPVDSTVYSYLLSVWFKFVEIPPDCHFAMIRILQYDVNHQLIEAGGAGIGSIHNTGWHQFGVCTNYGNTKYVKLEIGQWYDLMGEPDPLIEIRFDDVYFGIWNIVPDTPTITGETHGKVRTLYEYTITTTDPDQNNVQYQIDWGDNTTQTTAFYTSGEDVNLTHIWGIKGTYSIKAKAIDEFGAESGWAILSVTMPCSYHMALMPFWMRLFERFPNAFPLLRHLFGY
jgi:hypothetical protein